MSVDKFGRYLNKRKVARGPPAFRFSLTSDNNIDISNKRLCNVGSAVQKTYAVKNKDVEEIRKKYLVSNTSSKRSYSTDMYTSTIYKNKYIRDREKIKFSDLYDKYTLRKPLSIISNPGG